ncbi:MAG: class I SAM-dependent methyltransferase [Lachnospiraceae bacterium]|nr:class I SAM-dependent methyltransferase [Lachnospiraceae bacterium]
MNKNIEYYNENAQRFYETTVNVDMSLWRDKFESYVVDGGRILDAGCGSGRDSKAFKKHGYSVVAIDASKEMCRLASELLDQEVWQMRFDEIAFDEEFDGIWACASLLHVHMDELPGILNKLRKALKKSGILYASFKYGEGERNRGERTFSDFTEESVRKLLEEAGFILKDCGVTPDVRPGREDEKWINAIANI